MKKCILIFILTGLLLFIAACSEYQEPEMKLKFDVSDLTDEEYSYVGTSQLKDAQKEDFKKIEFTLEVHNTNEITNRRITFPEFGDLKKTADSYDIERYWYGSSSRDNSQAEQAEFSDEFMFYSKGLEDQDIINIFKSIEVKITWNSKGGDSKEKILKVGDVIQFK